MKPTPEQNAEKAKYEFLSIVVGLGFALLLLLVTLSYHGYQRHKEREAFLTCVKLVQERPAAYPSVFSCRI